MKIGRSKDTYMKREQNNWSRFDLEYGRKLLLND